MQHVNPAVAIHPSPEMPESAVRAPIDAGEDRDLILKAGAFRENFYVNFYPLVRESGMNPFEHYCTVGARQDWRPHPLFNTQYYLDIHPDVKGSDLHPLIHYLKYGGREWRRCTPMLDIDRYYENYKANVDGTLTRTIIEDFEHSKDRRLALQIFDDTGCHHPKAGDNFNEYVGILLEDGLAAGENPHILLELDRVTPDTHYQSRFAALERLLGPDPDLAQVPTHWIVDPKFYTQRHGAHAVHPTINFLRLGRRENVWIHPLFDPDYYAQNNALDKDSVGALLHYLSFITDDPDPNLYFDAASYRKYYGDKLKDQESLLQHYMRFGHMPFFETGRWFGQKFYLRRAAGIAEPNVPALVHYLHQGLEGGLPALPQQPFLDDTTTLTDDDLASEVKYAAQQRFELMGGSTPVVSVLLPTFQNVADTLRCVLSLLRSKDETPFTVLVLDDSAGHAAAATLARILTDVPGVVFRENGENLGFLRTCNAGAEASDTPYLFILNNDTLVLDGWLDEAMKTASSERDVGLVGSKLIYPSGLLQEAGGVIWSDGWAANFGRLDDPQAPEYCFKREVDYISGAAILIKRDVWQDVGGFSEYLVPAYYEDADLAMKLRAKGLRVIYQPLSVVIHVEGLSHGTDEASGGKRHMIINRERFREKWADVIADHGEHGKVTPAIFDRYCHGKVLFCDEEIPKPDRDAGSIRTFFMLKLLVELGFSVTYLPINGQRDGKYTVDLQRVGVQVLYEPYVSSGREYLFAKADEYDFLILTRVTSAGGFIPELKRKFPHLKMAFDTVDLHYLRTQRQAEASGDVEVHAQARELRKNELQTVGCADVTILTSPVEIDLLRAELGPFPHLELPLIYERREAPGGFETRADVAFVGGFRHPPNSDAVHYLVEEIWPRVRDAGLDARLHIIGADMPRSIHALADRDVVVPGFVTDIEAYFDNIRLSVAPLRFGAGIKGKVANALRLGVPSVCTPVAVEGMGLTDGQNVLVASSPAQFADAIIRAYTQDALWTSLSSAGKDFIDKRYGIEPTRRRLKSLCRALMPTEAGDDKRARPRLH
ncbi:MAG: glycosyltransferase [Pseudomonadota bacterium]